MRGRRRVFVGAGCLWVDNDDSRMTMHFLYNGVCVVNNGTIGIE